MILAPSVRECARVSGCHANVKDQSCVIAMVSTSRQPIGSVHLLRRHIALQLTNDKSSLPSITMT